MSNLAGRQSFEFGLARELRRIKHQGHAVIKRKLKSADGPGAHAARLTSASDNLNMKRPAQFSHKVERSNKRLKKRQERVGLHHEHAEKARIVAKWHKRQASKKRRGLRVLERRAIEANRKASLQFSALTPEQKRLRKRVPSRPQDKVQEIFISKLHAIRYRMPEAKNRGDLAKRKYLKAKK